MYYFIANTFIIICITTRILCDPHGDYIAERTKILNEEAKISLGGKTKLNDKEQTVNLCLMQHKLQEVDYAFDNPRYCNFSHHFFSYKNKIRDSKVYKIIKDMPKGAALHIHDMALLNPNYLMKITYMKHLHVCFDKLMLLKFSRNIPTSPCATRWQLMAEARSSSDSILEFDENLRKNFTMIVDDPDAAYPSITETWDKFLNYFITVAPMLSYRPVWEQYFYDALKAFREDNIMYIEVRSVLPRLYELDGTEYDPLITAKSYKKVIKKFVKDYPDFIGAKLIYAPSRHVDKNELDSYIKLAKQIKNDMPDIFAGFDLVGPEDRGMPLIDFVPQLRAAAKDLDYFFHAGETDWYGSTTDENLVDAILLGAKRIGHAYALPKHPYLVEQAVIKDIGLEVNVISNAVLSLVRDVRNHPLSVFLGSGLPVVISSDDPGAWEADPISDDYYVAFVGVASKKSDLALLKTLTMNSLKYSALDAAKKTEALNSFKQRWDAFINNFNCSHY